MGVKIRYMVEVYAIKLGFNPQDDNLSKLIMWVSDEKRNRINRYHRFMDKKRTLFGDILVRYLMCKKLKLKNSELMFDKGKYGKPFLINSNVHFNISHSGEWVVCAVHSFPLGIDIELVKPIDLSIAMKICTKDEYVRFVNKNDSERLQYFYDLWSIKESYVKAIGKGLYVPLDTLSVSICNDNITVKLDGCVNYFLKQYNIDLNYKMTVCAQSSSFSRVVEFVDENKLYDEFLIFVS